MADRERRAAHPDHYSEELDESADEDDVDMSRIEASDRSAAHQSYIHEEIQPDSRFTWPNVLAGYPDSVAKETRNKHFWSSAEPVESRQEQSINAGLPRVYAVDGFPIRTRASVPDSQQQQNLESQGASSVSSSSYRQLSQMMPQRGDVDWAMDDAPSTITSHEDGVEENSRPVPRPRHGIKRRRPSDGTSAVDRSRRNYAAAAAVGGEHDGFSGDVGDVMECEEDESEVEGDDVR